MVWYQLILHGALNSAATQGTFRFRLRAHALLALGLLISLVALTGCNDYGNTFQTPTGAPINFLAPATPTQAARLSLSPSAAPSAGIRHTDRRPVERQDHPHRLRQRDHRHGDRRCLTDCQARHGLHQHSQSIFRLRQQRPLQHSYVPRQSRPPIRFRRSLRCHRPPPPLARRPSRSL